MKHTPSSISDDYPAGTAVEVDGHGSGVVVAKKPGGWYSVQLSGAESAETISTRRASLRLSVGDASALASDMDQEGSSTGVSSPPPVSARTPGSGSGKRNRDRKGRSSAAGSAEKEKEKELPTASVAALSMEEANAPQGHAEEGEEEEEDESGDEEDYVTAEEGSAIKPPPARRSLPSRPQEPQDSSSSSEEEGEEEEEEAANGQAGGEEEKEAESSSSSEEGEKEGEGEEEEEEEEEKEGEEEEEEDVIALPSEKPSRSVLINQRLLEGRPGNKPLKSGGKPTRSMGLDTGLPEPTYIRYDSLGGKVMRATVGGGGAHPAALLKGAMLGGGPSEEVQKKLAVPRSSVYDKDPELERDVRLLMMRNVMDPKRFYKSLEGVGKGAQVGTVIAGPLEFAAGSLKRRERRTNLVDEILADRSVRDYAKRKFNDIQEANQSGRRRFMARKQEKKKPKWAK